MSARRRKSLKILFIGNSHTYYNDMPLMLKARADEEGYDCSVTMLAHPGWFLEQHVKEPEVRFNIMFGNYDYVVLQEHANPFGPEDVFLEAAKILNTWIREAGSIPVLYETWAKEDEPEKQEIMNKVYHQIADEIEALIAPVGENWWAYSKAWPHIEMYESDGAHASADGTEFAARIIWASIASDLFIERLGI